MVRSPKKRLISILQRSLANTFSFFELRSFLLRDKETRTDTDRHGYSQTQAGANRHRQRQKGKDQDIDKKQIRGQALK